MKKTKLLTSLAAFVLVLGLGACDGSEDGEVSESGNESESSSDSDSKSAAPYEDGSYFLGFNIDGVDNYITGEVNANYSYEGLYTDDITKAVPLTLKAVEGNGYTLMFTLEEVTYYVTTVVTTNDKGTFNNLAYSTSEGLIYWNDTYSCWGDESGDYFLCCNTTYKCLYLSDVETYITSSPIAKLYEIPEDWEPYTPREDEGVSYEEIEGLSLLGYYDFAKSVSTEVSGTGAFGATNGDAATGPTNEEVLKIFSDAYVAGEAETSPLASVSYNEFVYRGAGGTTSNNSGLQLSDACLKLGKSSDGENKNTGELTLTYEGYTLSNVVITAAGWNNTTTTLSVNDDSENAQTLTQAANALSYVDEVETYTYELSEATSLKLAGSARVLIFGIAIYGEEAPAEPESEILQISDLDYLCFEVDSDDSYIYGKTCESLTSCNVTFDTGDFSNTRWSSSFIRLYENATITFTPKDGHKLVGLSVTWGSNTTSKAISIVNDAATVVNSDTGAEITDIVDGTASLTIKNAGGTSEQLYFGNTTIYYY